MDVTEVEFHSVLFFLLADTIKKQTSLKQAMCCHFDLFGTHSCSLNLVNVAVWETRGLKSNKLRC